MAHAEVVPREISLTTALLMQERGDSVRREAGLWDSLLQGVQQRNTSTRSKYVLSVDHSHVKYQFNCRKYGEHDRQLFFRKITIPHWTCKPIGYRLVEEGSAECTMEATRAGSFPNMSTLNLRDCGVFSHGILHGFYQEYVRKLGFCSQILFQRPH